MFSTTKLRSDRRGWLILRPGNPRCVRSSRTAVSIDAACACWSAISQEARETGIPCPANARVPSCVTIGTPGGEGGAGGALSGGYIPGGRLGWDGGRGGGNADCSGKFCCVKGSAGGG